MAEKRTKPLSDTERLIIQNIFDTQPAKRKAYLERLGFEMNPEDENEYKPIGSDQPYGEIDPGFGTAYRKGGLSGLINEIGLDIGDIGFDMGIASPAAASGAVGAGLAASPLGPIAAILGGFGGGTAGNYVAEEAKNAAANLLLDKDIPMDRDAAVVQSLLVGAFPIIAKGGISLGKSAWKKALESRVNSIKKAVGSGLTNDMVDVIAKDPDKFTVEGVKNANKELSGVVKRIFGQDDALKINTPDSIPAGGMFRSKIDPLNEAAEAEIKRLAKDPINDMTLSEVDGFFKNAVNKIKAGKDEFELDEDAKRAVNYLQGIRSEVKKTFQAEASQIKPSKILDPFGKPITPEPTNPESIKLNFEKVYNLGKKIQKDSWDFHENAPGSNILRSFTGGDPQGITKILDQKAPALAKINAERSKIMDAYNFAAERVNRNNIKTFYTGADNPAKVAVREGLEKIDEVMGTKLAPEVEKGGVQSFVKDIFERNTNGGSKNLRAVQVQEGVKGAIKGGLGGMGAGSLVGNPTAGGVIGAPLGAIQGVNEAARLTDPEYALKELLKARTQAAAIQPNVVSVPQIAAGTGVGAAMVGAKNEAPNMPQTQQQLDASEPWPDIDAPATPTPQPSPSASPSSEPWPEI